MEKRKSSSTIKASWTASSYLVMVTYDSLCKIHSNSFCFYCIKYQKFMYSQTEHKSHRIINLMEFAYTKDSKKS